MTKTLCPIRPAVRHCYTKGGAVRPVALPLAPRLNASSVSSKTLSTRSK